MSIDPNKLNAMLDEQDALRARQRAATSPGVTSAQMGEAIRLGRQQGVPPMVVADDIQGFSERSRLDQVQQAAKDSPALGRWMKKPENAPFAREDIGNLSKLTKAISRTFQVTQDHGVAAGFKTWRNHLADWKNIGEGGEAGNRAAPQPFYVEELASSAHAGLKRAESKYVWAADALTPASLKAYQSEHDRQFGTALQLAKIERQAQAREMGFSDGTQAAFEGLNKARGKGPLAAASAWLQNPRAIGITFSQSVGMGADALVATMATGGGSKIATMGASGAGSFGVEYGASMQEVLEESGVDVTDPIQVAAALRNPELMAAAKQKAATRGFIIGATDFVFAGMAGKFLQNANRNMRSAAWRTGAEGATQMGGEALGELGAQLATEDEVDWVEVAGEAIAGLPFAGAEVHANYRTARANGELRYQKQRINGEMNKALASAAGARQFGDILGAAQATDLSKTSPEAFAELLGESIPADANVYLSLDSARTLFQDGLEEFIGEFAGGEAAGTIADVAASGGDLVIPVADFIAKVAARADAAEIARHVRLDADHVSRAELESDELMAQWMEQIAAYDTSDAAVRATPEQAASADKVAQDVTGMIVSTGRYRKDDAELQGKLWGRFFGMMAERSGQDAFELYQHYNARIRNAPTAVNTKPNTLDPRTDAMLTAIRAGTIPDGREVFGDSLLAFLVGKRGVRDDGGELSHMDAGKQRPGLINNVDGLSLDEARALAVEAGYLRDVGAEQDGVSTSGIDDLLDAIRAEFAGNPAYTEANADPDKLAWRNDALAIQRQLDDNTKLRDMTSEEFGALSNQDIYDILNPSRWQRVKDGVRDLLQRGKGKPESGVSAFRESDFRPAVVSWAKTRFGDRVAPNGRPAWQNFVEWFGDSQVVDANGEPLVVYHGGRSTFSEIKRGFGNFLGGLFVREGKPSGYGEKQFELFLRGEVLELDVLSDLLETEEGQKVLSEMLPNDVDEDVLSEVAEALTDGSHYPDSEVVWDAIGAVDEADSAAEIQVLRGRLAQAFGYPSVRTPDEFDGDTIMVMEPDAIKSATDNNGNFSASAGSILFQDPMSEREAGFRRRNTLNQDPAESGVSAFRETDYRPSVVAWAKARWGDAIAPNGNPIWQNFVAWFDGSQVVDANGEPLVVYHGTWADFNIFDFERLGETTDANAHDAALAETARIGTWFSDRDISEEIGATRNVAAYLAFKNPKQYRSVEQAARSAKKAGGGAALRANLESQGFDGVRVSDEEFGGVSYVAFRPEQIKSATDNNGNFSASAGSILFQDPMSEREAGFRRWSAGTEVVASGEAMTHDFRSGEGVTVEAFHGAKRPDRIGKQFNPKRATSGPMVYFTNSPDLASNYATNKADTSLADEDVSFGNWFKFKPKGARSSVPIDRAWWSLTPEQRANVTEAAQEIRLDDDAEKVVRVPGNRNGLGNLDWEISQARGNVLAALTESWLTSGSIYGEEHLFNDVLRLAGVPMDAVTYDNPNAEYPSVFPVHIRMGSPLVTNDIPANVMSALEDAAKRDRSRAVQEGFGADAWDKRTITLRQWVADLKGDRSEHVWTRIPDKVTDVFRSLGYDGIIDMGGKNGGTQHRVYIPFSAKGQVKGKFNRGGYDTGKNDLLAQADGNKKRGAFNLDTNVITLFAQADMSTLLHESMHFFLEVMQDVALESPDVRADLDRLRAWTGNDGGPFTVDQHEQIARGFEAYLREGKAPAPELRGMFARFRAWLLDVYRALSQLNVTLSDDVREVFDRMLATDAEIDAAQARQEMRGPMELTDEARAILSDKQWEAYVAMTRDAAESAKAEVLAKLLKAHRREQSRWYKEERAAVRDQVSAEFDEVPAVRAWRVLSGAAARAEVMPEPLRNLKLDKAELLRRYGQAWLNDNLLRLRVYANQGGVDPEIAAAMLGFGSGDHLVKALATVKDLQARIEAETDARMQERRPDPALDGSLPEAAMKAVHNNARVRVLEQELAMLSQLANQPAPPVRAIREWARRKVADTVARQLRPNDYLVAERRAAREATKAAEKGDFAKALAAKRQQAMQAALYSEAMKAREVVIKRAAAFKRAGKRKVRERVGKVAGKLYLDALDALLDTYALHDAKGPQEVTRAALRAWVNEMQDNGHDTAIADSVLMAVESGETLDLRDLTITGIEELHEAIQNVLHHAREEGTIRTLNGELEWDAVKADMLETLDRLEARPATGLTNADRSMLEKLRDLKDAGWNWVLQPETVIEWLDGGTSGIFHDVLWNQSEVAEAKKNALKRLVGNKLKAALDALSATERKALDDTHFISGLGRNLSGHTILSVLLNMGNASNRDKLMRGGVVLGDEITPLTPEAVAEMLSKLSAAQVNLAQEIWDSVNLLWPEIVAMQEAAAGFAPPKIEAEPITVVTKDGPVTLRGGYFPAAYDPKGSKAGQQAEQTENVRQLAGATPIPATTSKGHLNERTSFAGPLLLDYHAVLSRHLDGVMSDIAYRQFLRQALKVLKDPDIRRAIDNRIGPNAARIVQTAFERGAVGQYTLAPQMFGPWQKVVDNGLANITSAALGFRATLAAANIATVPVLAMARMSPWQVMRGIASYYFGSGANVIDNMRANIKTIHALSPMMQRRAEARSVEYGAVLDSLRGERGFRKQMIEAALAMQQWTVPLAENAVWLGKYQAELEAGKGPAEAAIAADKVIRQTQMKSASKDLSMAEGNPYLRAMMMFAGPLVIINNRLQESGLRGLRGDVKSPGQAIGVWLAMAMGGAWLFELMMGRGAGDEDDDGDTDAWDWMVWAGKKLALMPFAGYPILREITGYMDNGFVRPHPIVDSGKALADAGAAAWNAGGDFIAGEDVDGEKLAKSAVRAGGVAYGLPSNQMLRTGQYLMEVGQGEHVPENPAKEAWYLMQGPPKE